MAKSTAGRSIILSSILAFLSYIPFEYIAKATLIFCVLTFVTDPFPPTSRIAAVGCVGVVLVLSKVERKWREGQEDFGIHSAQDSVEDINKTKSD
mmetsp:Transcript_9421/g.13825  ORF Transcript_9421/g.13825 Transcript_9421/m.13825 type:complete len:95 (+) Transcript_9421:75-359(+)